MSDGRRTENPSLPSNHACVPGPAVTGPSPSSLGLPVSSQQQTDASFNFMLQGRMGTFAPPLNMAPIFPPAPPSAPGMKAPSGKTADLGPPMFQIPLNLGHPAMSMAPRPSSTGGPPTLTNPAGIFMASAANPAALYNSLPTGMSHSHHQPPFLMFQPGGSPAPTHPPVSGLLPAMSDRTQGTPLTPSSAASAKATTKPAAKTVAVTSSSSSPASPSQPRKKHSPSSNVQPQALSTVTSSNSHHSSSNQDEEVNVDSGGNGPYNSYQDVKPASDLSRLLPAYHPSPMVVLPPPFGPSGGPLFPMQPKVPLNAGVPGSGIMRSLADSVQEPVSEGQTAFVSNMQTSHFDPDQLLVHGRPYVVGSGSRGEGGATGRRTGDAHPHSEWKTVGLPSDGSEATVNARDSNDMLNSAADEVMEMSGGGQPTAHQDHKITSLVQAASRALSGQQQQNLVEGAASQHPHSHLHNDSLVSEVGVPSVKTEPSSLNSSTHVTTGRVGSRPGGARPAQPLTSTSGQGSLKTGMYSSSSAGKAQTTSAGLSHGFIGYAGPVLPAAVSTLSSLHTSSLSVTHSPRASSTSNIHSGMPSSPISTPPRPSILIRKRSHDNLRKGDMLSPDAARAGSLGLGGSQSDSNHHSSDNSADMLSPRKKPRKQNMLLTDDKFASNVPEGPLDGVNALACRNEDLPPSPDRRGSPSLGKDMSKQQQESTGTAVKQLFMDDTDFETRLRCLAELKRPSVLSGCKVNTKAAHFHFWRYSDLRTKEQSKPTVFSIAQKKNSRLRVKGWRVGRINDQLESMVDIERDVLATLSQTRQCAEDLLATQHSPPEEAVKAYSAELVQGNFDRSNNLLASFQQTQSVLQKIVSHKSNAVELVQKCAPDVFSLSTVKDRLLASIQQE